MSQGFPGVPDAPDGARITYQHQYRACGKRGCTVCRPPNPGHGPYWYAYWRAEGRLHSYYIGKTLPVGVDLTRQRHLPKRQAVAVSAGGPEVDQTFHLTG